jgi:endoglucanase
VAPVDELLIDTGLSAERLADLVRVGDVVSAAQPPRQLQGDYLAATYLDNRASVVAVTECLDALQHRPHGWDVVAVATVQEETRLLGAFTSAFALRPQLAIAIDVTQGTGSASKDFSDKTYPLGGGPVLGLGPNIHSKLHGAIKSVAEKMEMPHTLEAMPTHSGTDAFAMQVAREGIPTMVVSIPLRNMHTPVEIVAVKDVVRVGRLLAEFIAGLTPEFMETLALD